MVTENILIKFLIIISVLFFLPRVINRFYKIPSAITEIFLGIGFGILIPSFFFIDDMINILATLGIITLFVYSGMDVNTNFILKKKRFFIENIVIQLLIFLIISIVIKFGFSLSYQVSFLVSLALTTPSASYILSMSKNLNENDRKWIEGKAITGELTAIILFIILRKMDNFYLLILVIIVIMALIFILPKILKMLYKKLFSKLIGTEFSFIFVVAVISAYITELIGVHFLVGAFIAGVVSRKFVNDIVKDSEYKHINRNRGKQIIEGFGFFALVFIPFYFFKIGLKINPEMLSITNIIYAIVLCLIISLIRVLLTSLHRVYRIGEKASKAIKMSSMLLPTLVFTFVITEIINLEFNINYYLFSILMLYGILTAIISIITVKIVKS
ncbi:MAG: cation:proton antiporter [archaeon]